MSKPTYEIKGYHSKDDFYNQKFTLIDEYIPNKRDAIREAKQALGSYPVVKITRSDYEWIQIFGFDNSLMQNPF